MQDKVRHALDTLRTSQGLYVASPSNTYHYIWIRDNCYMAFADLDIDNSRFTQTYHSLLDIFRKYEAKLTYHAKHKPEAVYEYIHPRYSADSVEEIWEPWGNAQNDAIGAFLFGIGQGLQRGLRMLRDNQDRHVITLLIEYLETLQFWKDDDNGMWEEVRERHSSSIGACTAGLLAVRPYFQVDWVLIQNGLQALFQQLPRESPSHETDLALLSLIYPYRLLPQDMAVAIVQQVEAQLLRTSGVIRYHGDAYYEDDKTEAEWCMGLPWLGLCHSALGNAPQAQYYLQRTEAVMTSDGKIPELILGKERTPNENLPLGWALSLYLILSDKC